MNLTVIGSGSDGNCYLLECGGEILILDCGCHLMEVKKKLNFDLSGIVGCYISHCHLDHSKYISEYAKLGIKVFTPYKVNVDRISTTMNGFNLQAFRVPHGDADCYGVLISHKSGEKAIYITDFNYCKYRFDKVKIQHFLIECNYQKEYIDVDAPNFEHKAGAHCSLDTCKEFVELNKTDALKSVILLHLGAGSVASEMVEEIGKVVNENVLVDYARPNEYYRLSED